MFIRSERLFLRPAWPEDWPELLVTIGDEAVVKNLAKGGLTQQTMLAGSPASHSTRAVRTSS